MSDEPIFTRHGQTLTCEWHGAIDEPLMFTFGLIDALGLIVDGKFPERWLAADLWLVLLGECESDYYGGRSAIYMREDAL